MADRNIGAVLVIKDNKLAGILSERDCARKVELAGKTAATTKVAEIMTPDVVTVTPDHTCDECMLIMHEKRIRHLPVAEGGQVVGILSNRDVLEEVISEREATIRELARARLEATTYTGSY
jgi:CBS domain-containing protein